MVLDERSRHELYLKLEDVLGPEQATTLMEMLPPVGWADVATKRDLDQFEQRMELRFEAIAHQFEGVAHQFVAFEQRLRAEISDQTKKLLLVMLGTSLTILGTTLGAVFAVS